LTIFGADREQAANGLESCYKEIEMYRSGGIGIVGVIVIVLVILWLVGVIKI
jgi:hypothetical protein